MRVNSILVVDDSEAVRYLLKRVIEQTGLVGDVIEAADGKEALDIFNNYQESKVKYENGFPPGIIFLDLNMPLVDGFGFLDEFVKLRENKEEYKDIIVLVYSSSNNEEDQKRVSSYNLVKEYIVKGNSGPKEMKAKVEEIVEELNKAG